MVNDATTQLNSVWLGRIEWEMKRKRGEKEVEEEEESEKCWIRDKKIVGRGER